MKDLGAVLLCFLGGLFLFGAWHIFLERHIPMPGPESDCEQKSDSEFQGSPSWFGAFLAAAALLLNPVFVLFQILGKRDKGWTPGWFAQCFFFVFSGSVFLATGLYLGFT